MGLTALIYPLEAVHGSRVNRQTWFGRTNKPDTPKTHEQTYRRHLDFASTHSTCEVELVPLSAHVAFAVSLV